MMGKDVHILKPKKTAASYRDYLKTLAKEYKADVIAEIENSNFNPNVITSCISQANANGYTLSVQNVQYDEDNFYTCAEVVLGYKYTMPLFNISADKTTRGIAR